MGNFILSHDIGTTGDKAALFGEDGRMVASGFAAYPTSYPRAGWAEQDAEAYWKAFCESTRRILAVSKCDPRDIAAVAFSGQMMGALPVAADGTPLRPAIIWADQRATVEAEEIGRTAPPDEVYRITGHRLSASYSAAKIAWIRRNELEVYRRAAKFLHAKDFLALRLTGRFVSDYSDASGMNLLDLGSMDWSPLMLEASGISRDLLPDLCESTEVVGSVRLDAARASGLLAGTPVVIGGGDGACATCGAGVVAEGDAYLCLGTSTWIASASSRPLIDPAQRTFTFALLRKGLYMPTGTMQTGGGSLEWLKEAVGSGYGTGSSPGSPDAYEALNRDAAAVAPGSDGLVFLPYLLGERSPRWNPRARGCFVGLSMMHGKAHLARAVMEGVAFNMKIVADAFRGLGLDSSEIRVIGGGARSPVWLSIFADILERPMVTLNFVGEATSIGAAIAGGVGAGLFPGIEEAARLVRPEKTVDPDPAHVSAYRPMFPIFERAYEQLVPVFDMLAAM